MNLIEYLVKNLLENIQQMISLMSYRNFSGVFFVKNNLENKSSKTLGNLKGLLSCYEFPDSKDFLDLIHKFSENRNGISHRLLTMSKKDIDDGAVEKQLSELHNQAEEILNKYNTITNGIVSIWYQSIGQGKLSLETLPKKSD